MSLVNDMLRDLDRRKRQTSGSSASGFPYDDKEKHFSNEHWKVIMITCVGVMVGATAVYIYFKQNSQGDFFIADSLRNEIVIQNGQPRNSAVAEIQNEAPANLPASALTASNINVFERENSDTGFIVGITSEEDIFFEIVSRDSFGINLLLHDIENIRSNEVEIGGFSLIQGSDGVNVVIELNTMADFQVSEEKQDANDPGMRLLIEATYQDSPVSLSETENPQSETPQLVAQEESGLAETRPGVVAGEQTEEPEPGTSADAGMANASFRTSRALSFEERDINLSKEAASLIQRGQLTGAYDLLLGFIGENPEAHRSRETLAALMFAQQEYLEANVIVDQGLNIAPNYAAYKKIKARIYLMNGMISDAVELLRNQPPALDSDPEYFELLASSYQQNSDYQNAVSVYQQLLRFDRERGRWWAGLGVAHESLGNVDDALSSYQAAMQVPDLEPALRQYSQNRIRYLRN